MQAFNASINYIALSYKDLEIQDEKIIVCKEVKDLHLKDLPKNPTLNNPHFWKKVRQLYFDFEDKNWQAIRNFYFGYGKILSARFHKRDKEYISDIIGRLNWFRALTVMVEWAKSGKLAPLREMFGEPRESKHLQIIYFVNMKKVTFPILPDDPPQQEIQPISGLPTIRYLPKFDPRRSKMVWVTPQNDTELLAATWEAVTEAMTDMLQSILLFPDNKEHNTPRHPLITWGFLADGALQAAFLQWFFQEIAYINVTNCAADGCNNIVLPPRERFCSEKCRQREKKRRQRSSLKQKTRP